MIQRWTLPAPRDQTSSDQNARHHVSRHQGPNASDQIAYYSFHSFLVEVDKTWPYSYSHGWTDTSIQLRLVRGISFEFGKIPRISLGCMLVPVQPWEYEYRLLGWPFTLHTCRACSMETLRLVLRALLFVIVVVVTFVVVIAIVVVILIDCYRYYCCIFTFVVAIVVIVVIVVVIIVLDCYSYCY